MTTFAREIARIAKTCKAVPTRGHEGYCASGGLDFATRLEAFSRRVERSVLAVRHTHPWGSLDYDAAISLGVVLGRARSQAETAMNECTGKFTGPESNVDDRDSVAHNYVARSCVALLGAHQMWPRKLAEAWFHSLMREL